MTAATASDWLPGIRDEHEDDGWSAKWLDRPTWTIPSPERDQEDGTRPPAVADAGARGPGPRRIDGPAQRSVQHTRGHGEADPASARAARSRAERHGAASTARCSPRSRTCSPPTDDTSATWKNAAPPRPGPDRRAASTSWRTSFGPGRPLESGVVRVGELDVTLPARGDRPSCRTPRICWSCRLFTTATTIALKSAPCCRPPATRRGPRRLVVLDGPAPGAVGRHRRLRRIRRHRRLRNGRGGRANRAAGGSRQNQQQNDDHDQRARSPRPGHGADDRRRRGSPEGAIVATAAILRRRRSCWNRRRGGRSGWSPQCLYPEREPTIAASG